ncbi:MAG: hypothetical protein IPQ18_10805 [Saprospiraceae bacterium]|nr:hypothetical protein [Saprospiraceae bacterium]
MNRIWTALVLNIFTSILTLVGLAYLTWNHIFSIENFLQFSSIIYFSIFIVALIYFKPFPQNITDFNTHFTYHMLQGKWFFMTAISQWWAGNLFVVASGVYLDLKHWGIETSTVLVPVSSTLFCKHLKPCGSTDRFLGCI